MRKLKPGTRSTLKGMHRARETIRVFIENERGAMSKNVHDEKRLVFEYPVPVSRPYPFAYGFIIDTNSGDGDNLDCYVLTRSLLRAGQIVECEPVGLMEQWEDGQEDHNILATPLGESFEMCGEVQDALTEFVSHVFEGIPERKIVAGRFLGKPDAIALIARCRTVSDLGGRQ